MYLYHYLPVQSSRLHLQITDKLSDHLQTSYEYILHLSFLVVLSVSFEFLKYTYWDFRYKKATGEWLSPWRKPEIISIHLPISFSPSFQISSLVFHFLISELSSVITFPGIPVYFYTMSIQS